ncbi:unnamed protein product, partial [Mesorhabditis belari]|uniref:Uncharacterized protein n=1 Tax=Mesorhabditis belari TaxID=2138241 RepID=A0AAF3JBT4_9BILA
MTLRIDSSTFDVPFEWYIYHLPPGISTTQSDFSNLAELLQSCADLSRIRLPKKFQDYEQKAITYPERKYIGAPKSVLECLDVTDYLVLKDREAAIRPSEIRGGPIDALIVFATQASGSLLYQEAFLSTYRTFTSSHDLLQKLTHRYVYMALSSEPASQKAARLTFSVIVRVVDELCTVEINKELVAIVTNFVYRLIRDGNFQLARLLRTRLIERIESSAVVRQPTVYMDRLKKGETLLDFRSATIAQQLTLLDQRLFQAIEPAELLWWAEAQDEKRCPNLVAFTEQFNKMSYWVRTVVLTPKEHKERERYMNKFVKIMKQLRRLGNFNAYLAILSALDSGPVRRLEWGKMATEQLKEHAVIMDSSGSFKIYRTALVETAPPCIPYVGLVLQDLTFVHVGNVNYLHAEAVKGRTDLLNFGKRWQQFAILDSIRKLKRWNYSFTRDDRIIAAFKCFTSLTEDETWELSEMIKPRQRRNP